MFSIFRYKQLSISSIICLCVLGCSNFLEPIKKTDIPTEYEFNYWILNSTYLFQEELKNLPEEGDSVQALYNALSDAYTRYIPPSNSESVSTELNTSIIEGDVGMEYYFVDNGDKNTHPIIIYRVYPQSPAGKANIPRYATILSANGIDLVGHNAKIVYDSILAYSSSIELEVLKEGKIKSYSLQKETIYAPTIFLDTLDGIEFITISEFKPTTANQEQGSYGELKSYLDSTQSKTNIRVLDLRNNPGGHVNQCLSMADLFIPNGILSSRHWFSFAPDGDRKEFITDFKAINGDSGENGKFVILANNHSASCAEIFIAAIKDLTHIPIAGENTYGKGIGQSQWNTISGGLAIITSLEFYPPNGKSYHKIGIKPDFTCDPPITRKCALDAASHFYGLKTINANSKKNIISLEKTPHSFVKNYGGAIDTDSIFLNSLKNVRP